MTADVPNRGLDFVDFHSHFAGPALPITTLNGVPEPQRAFWAEVNRRLTDPDALIEGLDSAGMTGRVINTPLEFVRPAQGDVAPGTVRRINDSIAEHVARHPGRLYGLATVDAYEGERAAIELTRAVRELGLRGVFVESARGELLPDAAEARPTFAAAAELGVPVFVHPVPDPLLRQRFKRCGRLTERLARSSINSAALLAMLESGMFEEIRGLHVVVTALALGGVLLAAGSGDGSRICKSEPASTRRNVYVDTTGMHPAALKAAIDLLGVDHVVMGTDWPVVVEASLPKRMQSTLAEFGLDEVQQNLITGGNALRLLGQR